MKSLFERWRSKRPTNKETRPLEKSPTTLAETTPPEPVPNEFEAEAANSSQAHRERLPDPEGYDLRRFYIRLHKDVAVAMDDAVLFEAAQAFAEQELGLPVASIHLDASTSYQDAIKHCYIQIHGKQMPETSDVAVDFDESLSGSPGAAVAVEIDPNLGEGTPETKKFDDAMKSWNTARKIRLIVHIPEGYVPSELTRNCSLFFGENYKKS